MSDRTLAVTRLVTEHIEGIVIDDAFYDLLNRLGVTPQVERREAVTSAKPGDETRTYIVSVHRVPGTGTDGTTEVYACTCGAFKFHELPNYSEMTGDIEAGFERIGRCKHGDEVAVKDRTTEDRETGQQGFETFADQHGSGWQ